MLKQFVKFFIGDDPPMQSRREFQKVIYDYYKAIVGDKIPEEHFGNVVNVVTDYHYKDYKEYRAKYPKAVKRYSTFQVKDLDHPYTQEMIVRYFKERISAQYKELSALMLGLTVAELELFEQSRAEFGKMF